MKTRSRKQKLLPCPFCGGKAKICSVRPDIVSVLSPHHKKACFILCEKCRASLSPVVYNGDLKDEKISFKMLTDVWNRRV